MTITAEQARVNSSNSKYGTEEVLKSIYRTIEAVSKTGSEKMTQILSKEAVSKAELEAVILDVKSKGYTVDIDDQSPSHYFLNVAW